MRDKGDAQVLVKSFSAMNRSNQDLSKVIIILTNNTEFSGASKDAVQLGAKKICFHNFFDAMKNELSFKQFLFIRLSKKEDKYKHIFDANGFQVQGGTRSK